VVLAGLLLKLGGYGYIRVVLPILSYANYYYYPLAGIFCLLSVLYASFTTIRQVDLKRIIAYSSIAHMNIVLIGIFSCNLYGLEGSVFLMLAHGIVSSALFFSIGILYIRHGTRLLYYFGGLASKMPLLSFYLLLFCLANTGAPGTCNFIGELLVFIGLVNKNLFVLCIVVFNIVFSVIYTMWFFNRIIFGNLKILYIKN
jgi:NADH:ubiquinone oxidoreductase subunit 4 (subunit M)